MNKYQSYKSSGVEWIGDIPERWICVGTNKVYQNLGTGTTPTSDNEDYYSEDGYHWITTTDLNEGVMYDTLTKISDKSIKDYPNLKLYPTGSIYISMYGGKIGKLGVSTFESYCNQSVCVLPKNDKISVKFYYYWFLGFQDFVKNMGRGGGQPNINKEMIKQFPTVKIPLLEQEEIVQFLDNKTDLIDKLISTKERKITLLKEQRTSLINEVVTKGLNPNVKMKDSGVEWIGEVPEHWIVTKFNRYVFFQEGPGLRTFQFTDNGTKVICVTNITENGIDFSYKKFISTEEYLEKYQHFTVQKGDLLLSSSGNSWGKVSEYLEDEKVMLNTSTIRLNTLDSKRMNKTLIKYILKSEFVRTQLDILMTGSCQPNFGPSHLNQLIIPIPPIEEQIEIVSNIEKNDLEFQKLIQLEQKKIELLKEYRQSLILNVVTGKIKVTTDE